MMGVLLLAGVIRGGLIAREDCISRDGVHFVTFSKQLQEDPVRWMKITTKQPGYSLMLEWTHRMIGPALGGDTPVGWQRCGQVIALLGGVAVCGCVFVLTRRLFDERFAALAGVLCAFWPQGAVLSADVLSDMPHLGMYLLAVLFADRMLGGGRLGGAIGAGLLAAGAYWLRQEAIGLVAAIGLCLFLERSIQPKRRVLLATAFAACFIAGVAPYSMMVGRVMPNKNPGDMLEQLTHTIPSTESATEAGRVHGSIVNETGRRPGHSVSADLLAHVSRMDEGAPAFAAAVPIWKLPGRMAEEWARSGRYVLAVLVLAALFVNTVPRAERRGARLIAAAIGAHLLLVVARTGVYGEISSRYMIIPAALTIPWAAAAMWTLTTGVASRIYNPTGPRKAAVWFSALMIALVPMLYYIVRPEPRNKNALRTAGDWLRERRAPGDIVLGHARMEQLLYYADLCWPDDGRWRRTKETATAANIESISRRTGARWYVDAIDVRDEEIDVSALMDGLALSKSRDFTAKRFDESESLGAFVVEIGPIESPSKATGTKE